MAEQSQDIKEVFTQMVKTLVSLIEEKDTFVKGHSDRVASLCVRFSKKLNLPRRAVEKLYLAGLLHDIGMVVVPVDVLQKPAELSEEEMAVIRQHPIVAERVLSHQQIFTGILPIIRHHHECCDGSGYPDGLNENSIPLGAKILGLCDAYDAMISPRSYRTAYSIDQAIENIKKSAAVQFDSRLVNEFIEYIRDQSGPGKEAAVSQTDPEECKNIVRTELKNIMNKYAEGDFEIPLLPKVLQKVSKVIRKFESTPEDVANAVEKDASITTKVIAIANSPTYRGAEKITSIKQAVSRLGMRTTRNVVAAIAQKGLYKTKNKQFKTLMETLWMHSLACAYCSKKISEHLMFADPDKYFLMGLVHDVGKSLLIRDAGETIVKTEAVEIDDVLDGIQEIHGSFGGHILEMWGYTPDFVKVAQLHDSRKLFDTTPQDVQVVHIANTLTRSAGYGFFHDQDIDLAELAEAGTLEISPQILESVRSDVHNIMTTSAHMF